MDMDKYIDALYYEECKKHRDKFENEYYEHDNEDYNYEYEDGLKCLNPRFTTKSKDNKNDISKNKKAGPIIIPYSTDGSNTFNFEGSETMQSISVGFGASEALIIEPTGIIDGIADTGITAFNMSRPGCLDTLTVSAAIVDAILIPTGVTLTIVAQLYKAECNSSIFMPIPGTKIIIAPVVTTITARGTVFNGIRKNINYSLNLQERLALVFTTLIPNSFSNPFDFSTNLSGGVTIL
jgi:hypothetical protein